MTEEQQNFDIYAGDINTVLITVTNLETGNFKELSGCAIEWVLYDPNKDEVLIRKTTASGITTLPSGIMAIDLLEQDTIDILPANWYVHEAEVTDLDGIISTVTTGFVHVKRSKA